MSRAPRLHPGFSLIELLVVLAIMAVLATTTLPIAELAIQRHKEQELRLALREIRTALDAYKRAYDDGRMLRRVGASGYPKTLEELVDGVEDVRDPARKKMFFLRRIPIDPMGDDDAVTPADSWAKRAYVSEAAEPKEGADVYDVMSRSSRMGLNGLAYSQW
jgi:general secretion pathway protein G